MNHAITSSGVGRLEIGKNVPEKRNIGRITKRKIAMNETSISVRAAQAASGAVNDEPHEDRDRDREHAERRVDCAESGDDDEVDRRRQDEPEGEERLVAEHDVSHAQRASPASRGTAGPT